MCNTPQKSTFHISKCQFCLTSDIIIHKKTEGNVFSIFRSDTEFQSCREYILNLLRKICKEPLFAYGITYYSGDDLKIREAFRKNYTLKLFNASLPLPENKKMSFTPYRPSGKFNHEYFGTISIHYAPTLQVVLDYLKLLSEMDLTTIILSLPGEVRDAYHTEIRPKRWRN